MNPLEQHLDARLQPFEALARENGTAMNRNVTAPDGIFHGRYEDGIVRFSSIRYGDCQRFGEPLPHSDAGIEIDATIPSPLCAQASNNIESFIMDDTLPALPQKEDALFLNVNAPESCSAGANLPVMVWIHGGAFKSGGASSPLYNPYRIVAENNVIVVSVNYRLGFFGFVRDQQGDLANLGMLDLLTALEWVHKNIAAFGGNPENVTIFGQSAGASAVQYLLATEAAGRLFNRAIIQSSCFGALEEREATDAFLLKRANEIHPEATTEEVLSAQERAVAENPEKGNAKYCAFAPRPGVKPLPNAGDLASAYSAAAKSGVELLVGYASREASLFALADPKLSRLVKMPLIGAIADRAIALKSKQIFSQGACDFARVWNKQGGRVFLYELSWGVGESLIGGCHCSELPLLLEGSGPHTSPLYMGKPDEQITDTAKRLRAIWAGFAKDGSIVEFTIPECISIQNVTHARLRG